MRAVVLTISTAASRRHASDESGPRLAELAESAGAEIVAGEVLPDDVALIEDRLRHHVDDGIDLILTTGGTGLAPDDVTPEAVRAVIEREVPGIGEALRAESLRHTPHGVLSRELAGVAGRTLIVSLPGSPRAVEQLFGVLAPVLDHATAIIQGRGGHGPR